MLPTPVSLLIADLKRSHQWIFLHLHTLSRLFSIYMYLSFQPHFESGVWNAVPWTRAALAGVRLLALPPTAFLNATCSCFPHIMTTGKHSACRCLPCSDKTSCCCCRPPLLIPFTNTITLHPQRSSEYCPHATLFPSNLSVQP